MEHNHNIIGPIYVTRVGAVGPLNLKISFALIVNALDGYYLLFFFMRTNFKKIFQNFSYFFFFTALVFQRVLKNNNEYTKCVQHKRGKQTITN